MEAEGERPGKNYAHADEKKKEDTKDAGSTSWGIALLRTIGGKDEEKKEGNK